MFSLAKNALNRMSRTVLCPSTTSTNSSSINFNTFKDQQFNSIHAAGPTERGSELNDFITLNRSRIRSMSLTFMVSVPCTTFSGFFNIRLSRAPFSMVNTTRGHHFSLFNHRRVHGMIPVVSFYLNRSLTLIEMFLVGCVLTP